MSRNQNKTVENDVPVSAYFKTIKDKKRAEQCRAVDELMRAVTRREPKMWGSSIVGYGKYHYRYDSGREGDFMLTGWSSRAKNLTLYIMGGFDDYDEILAKLGPHKTGKSCLYVTDLDKIDMKVLRSLIRKSVAYMRKTYKTE
ncbi:MAG: DUF1801 domain-containing protein [Pseudomonadota bacterium]